MISRLGAPSVIVVVVWCGLFAPSLPGPSCLVALQSADDVLSRWQEIVADPSRMDVTIRCRMTTLAHGDHDDALAEVSVKRLQDSWWVFSHKRGAHARLGTWESINEVLATDQYLMIQRQSMDGPAKLSGTIRRTSDPHRFYRGSLANLVPFFGLAEGDSGKTMPELMRQHGPQARRSSTDVRVSTRTPYGEFVVDFPLTNDGHPSRITITVSKGDIYAGGTVGKAGTDLESMISERRDFDQIRYQRMGDHVIPVSWSYSTNSQLRDGQAAYTNEVILEEVQFHAGHRTRDFRPETPIRDGSPVSVSDLPVECVWRNGRIEPRFPTHVGGQASGLRFVGQAFHWVLILGGVLVLVLAAFLVYRLRATG